MEKRYINQHQQSKVYSDTLNLFHVIIGIQSCFSARNKKNFEVRETCVNVMNVKRIDCTYNLPNDHQKTDSVGICSRYTVNSAKLAHVPKHIYNNHINIVFIECD